MSNKVAVGVVGLGLMGRALALRLLQAGHRVLGFDIQPPSECPTGLELVDGLSAMTPACPLILLAVFDTDQVRQVVCGLGGLLAQHGQCLTVFSCSTCDPDALAVVARQAEALGMPMLELPFSGTSAQVAQGEGLGLMGGDPELVKRWSTVLDVICPRREHVGGFGDANRFKLAVNLVLGLHRAALAEGLVFGRRLGLDPARLLSTLQNSAAASSVMGTKGLLMVERRYDQPQSRVDQSLKDFHLIAALGEERAQPLPLTHIYIGLLQSCAERGESHMDNAIIQEAIARLSPKQEV